MVVEEEEDVHCLVHNSSEAWDKDQVDEGLNPE